MGTSTGTTAVAILGDTAATGPGGSGAGGVSDQALDRVVDGGAGTMLSGTVPRPHLSLIVPAETVAELLAHQRALHDPVRAPSLTTHDDPLCAPIDLPWGTVAPATLEDGTPVPMSELARALCDCEMTRIVMTADSQPLDVGRTRRLFTPAQRKAAVARDQHCIWNGCDQPASRCEVHHLRWWHRDNGPTTITNAALTCRHHHGEIHRHDLTIHRLPPPPEPPGRRHTDTGSGTPAGTASGTAADTASRTTAGTGSGTAGHPPAGTITNPAPRAVGDREPPRYIFRTRHGHILNAPHGYDTDSEGREVG